MLTKQISSSEDVTTCMRSDFYANTHENESIDKGVLFIFLLPKPLIEICIVWHTICK